jgi:hypothetical protein
LDNANATIESPRRCAASGERRRRRDATWVAISVWGLYVRGCGRLFAGFTGMALGLSGRILLRVSLRVALRKKQDKLERLEAPSIAR